MATKNVITHARRVELAKITSGEINSIPKITHIALGDGGTDEEGNVIMPSETQEELNHEVARYPVGAVEFPVDTTARYTIIVGDSELVGISISEVGLIDEAGVLCAVRNSFPKKKDTDESFAFEFDDEF